MDIVLSSSSDQPIYLQIYNQISRQILKEALTAGSQLPPIRTVAKELQISVIPVKRAWEELDRSGFITTAAGRGTFVKEHEHSDLDEKRTQTAEKLISRDVAECKSLGLSCEEIKTLVERICDEQQS